MLIAESAIAGRDPLPITRRMAVQLPAERPPNTAYDEISPSIFPLRDFNWREVQLRAAPSLPGPPKNPGGQHGDDAARVSGRAGGFRYSGSALGYSSCRNRFILW